MPTNPALITTIRRLAYIITMAGAIILLRWAIPSTMIAAEALRQGVQGAGKAVLQAAVYDGGFIVLLALLLIFRKRALAANPHRDLPR